MNRVEALFERIAAVGSRHPKRLFLVTAVILLPSSAFLRGLRIETTTASVISADDAVSRAYRENNARFGDSSPLVIELLYRSVAHETVDVFTDQLAEELSMEDDIVFVDARRSALRDSSSRQLRAALLNGDPQTLEHFAERFTEDGLRRELLRTRRRLVTAADPTLRELAVSDVLNIQELLREFFESRMGNFQFSSSSPYFDAEDEDARLVFVQPRGSAEDLNYCMDLIARTGVAIARAKASIEGADAIEHRLTGRYAITGEASAILKRDLARITLIASFVVVVFLGVAFRNVQTVIMVVVPVAVSLLAALLFARFFFNPLNFMAAGFLAILLGLGIDFTLHCTARFHQILPSASSIEQAVATTLVDCGPPVSVGALTTAAAFLCLVFSDYESLAEFGLLTASGLTLTLCLSLVLFPAIAVVSSSSKAKQLPRVSLGWLPRLVYGPALSRPVCTTAASVMLVVVSLYVARGFSFEMDYRQLFPERLPALETADQVSESFGASFTLNTQVTLRSARFSQAMASQQELDRELVGLVSKGTIAGFHSPALFLAYPRSLEENQERIQEALNAVQAGREPFFRLLEELRFRADPSFAEYYDVLERAFHHEDAIDPDKEDARLQRFAASENGEYFLQTYVWTPRELENPESLEALSGRLENLSFPPDVTVDVTGTYRVFSRLNEMIRDGFLRISTISLAAVCLLVFMFLRRPVALFLSLVPLAGAIPVTFAFIVLRDIAFSPMAMGMTALIVGIGIDDGVHLITRTILGGRRHITVVLADIAPILLLTTVSTMIGFGSLVFASHAILASLGAIIAFGVFACWVFTMALLPPLHAWLVRGVSPPKIAVVLLLWTASLGTASAQDEADPLLSQLEENYNRAEAVSADFTRRTTVPQLVGEIVVSGKLVYQKPHFLKMEMRGDENLDLYFDGAKASIVDIDLDETEEWSIDEGRWEVTFSRHIPPFFGVGMERLRTKFEIDRVGALEQTVTYRLTPTSESTFSFRTCEFTLDQRGRVLSMRLEYDSGDTTEMEFSNWRRLPRVSDHYFRYRGRNNP